MTHGCLLITNGDPKYDVLLHTYHTGMCIAHWIKRIPTLMYNKRLYLRDRKQAAYILRFDGTYKDRLTNPQAVAAAVIAASPECLEPLPGHNDTSDLPDWGGHGDPVVLSLEGPTQWTIRNPFADKVDGEIAVEAINPHQMFVDLFPVTAPPGNNWNPPLKYPDCEFMSGAQLADAEETAPDVML